MPSSSKRPGAERRARLFLLAAAVLSFPLAAFAQDSELIAPRLNIPVPYVDLAAPVRENEFVTVPFLAQYVSGVYQFLISIVGLVAGFMIVIGGFQYLTAGGDKGRVDAGKRRILNALIGLTLAFGSYVILYAINPNLVSFEALKLRFIEPDIFEESLGTTTSATALDVPHFGDLSVGAASGPMPGSHVPTTTTCPFELTSTEGTRDARQEFYQKILAPGVLTAQSVRERVVQAADIANACNVNLGSCGAMAGTITALGARGSANYTAMVKHSSAKGDCLTPTAKGNCNGTRLRVKRQINQKQRLYMYGWRCDMDSSYSEKARQTHLKPDCVSNALDAVAKVREHFFNEAKAGRLPGWPDQWANELRPGDYVVIYNGNRDMVGAHAVIFVGWARDGMSMQVIQGGAGGSGIKATKARPGTWCVKSACGSRMIPLAYIWSPD